MRSRTTAFLLMLLLALGLAPLAGCGQDSRMEEAAEEVKDEANDLAEDVEDEIDDRT